MQEPSETLKAKLRAALEGLKAANPGREDQFRMAKGYDSVAVFEPGNERATVIYATDLQGECLLDALFMGKSGQRVGLAVDKQMYDGFPDPPRPEPRFKVGDRVRCKSEFADKGVLAVSEVKQEQGYDRKWYTRVRAYPIGMPGSWHESDESYYEPVEA